MIISKFYYVAGISKNSILQIEFEYPVGSFINLTLVNYKVHVLKRISKIKIQSKVIMNAYNIWKTVKFCITCLSLSKQ